MKYRLTHHATHAHKYIVEYHQEALGMISPALDAQRRDE
jgi:hypothetical protein